MTENALKECINVVVDAREKAREATKRRTEAYEEWERAYINLFDIEKVAKEACLEAEAKLRELTLQAYTETGNKAPEIGVGIKEMTILIYDTKIAFDWAKSHKMALKLDTEAFKKIAKADPPDFVKITTEPQATIATELKKVE